MGIQLRPVRSLGFGDHVQCSPAQPFQHREALFDFPVLPLVQLLQLLIADDQAPVSEGQVAVELAIAVIHGLQEGREPFHERGVLRDGTLFLALDAQEFFQLDG